MSGYCGQAHEAKENTKSFFNKAGDEAQREASRAEDKTRGFFGRASDETRRSADRAEDKARGCASGILIDVQQCLLYGNLMIAALQEAQAKVDGNVARMCQFR